VLLHSCRQETIATMITSYGGVVSGQIEARYSHERAQQKEPSQGRSSHEHPLNLGLQKPFPL
jgi:hypothetical protein